MTYHHLLLDTHDVLISEGRPSESFYPGPYALLQLPDLERARLLRAVPRIDPADPAASYGPRAAEVLPRSRVRALARAGELRLAEEVAPEPDRRSRLM